jgi:preprotein translocase subunit SecE
MALTEGKYWMSKDKSLSAGSLLQELFQVGVYKRNQGRITRQLTFAALAMTILLAARSLWLFSTTWPAAWRYGLTGSLLILGPWLSFRIVNYPRFADFLVAVEAEMNKVSWPTRSELFRSSLVVIFVIFALAFVLFCYDLFWQFVFGPNVLRILK